MTASVLQEATPADDAFGTGTAITSNAFGANATIGSTIEVWVTVSNTATLPTTVQDSAGQTYVNKGTVFNNVTGGAQQLSLYVLQNNASATKLTVTATWTAAQSGKGIWQKEIGGVTSTAYDNSNVTFIHNPGTGSNAVTGGAITPSTSPVLCSAIVMEDFVGNGSDLAAGTGYTLGTTGWAYGSGTVLAKSQSKRIATAVSTAATMTAAANGATGIYLVGLAMYDEAAGGTSGSGAITELADVVAASGSTKDTGSGAITEASDTVAATGGVTDTGSGAIAEAHDTVAGTGSVGSTPTGSGTIAESADVVAGTGSTKDAGSGTIAESADVIAGSGSVGTSGSGGIAENHDTVAGAGLIPPQLAAWRSVMAAVKAGSRRARLLVVGDSLTAGEQSTGAAMGNNAHSLSYPVQMTPLFLAAPAHQDSWFSNNNALSDFDTLDQYDFRITLGSGWIADTANPTLAGYPIIGPASSAVLAFTPANSVDNFTIWFETFPGSPQYTVNIGGASIGTLPMNAAAGIGVANFSVSAGTHTINIVSNGTAGGKIFGCEAWLSTSQQIQVFTAGADSWTAGNWVQNNGNAFDPLAMAEFLAPDLTLVCLGKNEQAQGISQTTFEANLRTLVAGLLNAGSPVVIWGPPLSSSTAFGMSEAAQLAYETNMSNVAASLGCTFYSLTQKRANWGSFAAANTAGFMFTGDDIHCTPAGYLDIAEALLGVIDSGVGAISEANDVVAGTGSTSTAATGAIAEAHDVVAATGATAVSGAGPILETGDVVSGTGATADGGSGAIAEANDTVLGSGQVGFIGSGSIFEQPDTTAGTGSMSVPGSGSVQELSDTVNGGGTVTAVATGSIIEAHDVVAGAGAAGFPTGSGTIQESSDIVLGTGSGGAPVFGGPRYAVSRAIGRTFAASRPTGRNFKVSATMSQLFNVKDPAESVKLTFDFTPDLALLPAVLLSGTPTITILNVFGGDTISLTQNGAAALDSTNKMVIVPITGGLTENDYQVRVVISTTDTKTILELTGTLPVRS